MPWVVSSSLRPIPGPDSAATVEECTPGIEAGWTASRLRRGDRRTRACSCAARHDEFRAHAHGGANCRAANPLEPQKGGLGDC
jgi:hypothetical protein